MKKIKKFAFRIDAKTLKLLRVLEEKTGNAKSVVIRNMIWQAVEQLDQQDRSHRPSIVHRRS